MKFIEAQREAEAEPEVPPVAAENAVRLMSIHQSKGLEFPVVVVADLAKKFNEQDLHGEIIFDEEFGLCPKVQPPQTGAALSESAALARAAAAEARTARRGTAAALRRPDPRAGHADFDRRASRKKMGRNWTQPQPVTTQKIAGGEKFCGLAGDSGLRVEVRVQSRKVQTRRRRTAAFALAAGGGCRNWRTRQSGKRKAESGNGICPLLDEDDGGKAPRDAGMGISVRRGDAAQSQVVGHGIAARGGGIGRGGGADFQLSVFGKTAREDARRKAGNPKSEIVAADTGTAHHKFLQHVALEKTGDRAALAAEAERLVREKILSADERAALDLDALAAFWNSQLGQKIRAQPANRAARTAVHRADSARRNWPKSPARRSEAGAGK